MKTFITALALAILVAAPTFSPSAAAAAHKTGRDTCQSQQNDKVTTGGIPCGSGIAADGPVKLEQLPMSAMNRKLRPLPPAKWRGVISSESWHCKVQNVSPIE